MTTSRRLFLGVLGFAGFGAKTSSAAEAPPDLEAALQTWQEEATHAATDRAKLAIDAYLRRAWPEALQSAGFQGRWERDARVFNTLCASVDQEYAGRCITPRYCWDRDRPVRALEPEPRPAAIAIPFGTLPSSLWAGKRSGDPVASVAAWVADVPALLAAEAAHNKAAICAAPTAVLVIAGPGDLCPSFYVYVNIVGRSEARP